MLRLVKTSVIVALALIAVGCKSRPSPEKAIAQPSAAAPTPSPVDLSASLDAVRAEFNAHKQQARLLTLLSPT